MYYEARQKYPGTSIATPLPPPRCRCALRSPRVRPVSYSITLVALVALARFVVETERNRAGSCSSGV